MDKLIENMSFEGVGGIGEDDDMVGMVVGSNVGGNSWGIFFYELGSVMFNYFLYGFVIFFRFILFGFVSFDFK